MITHLRGSTRTGNSSDALSTIVQSSSPPAFTGSLELSMEGGMESVVNRLVSLPSGIHPRKLTLKWSYSNDPALTTALVEECFDTLESLDITHTSHCKSTHICVRADCLVSVLLVDPGVQFGQSLESEEAYRCGVSVRKVEPQVGRHGTPNHHIRPSLTNFAPHTLHTLQSYSQN